MPILKKLSIKLRVTQREMAILIVIEKAKKYRAWWAVIVVAPKTKEEARITKFNKRVERENYLLPRIENIFATLEIDANSGYQRVELEEESRKCTWQITFLQNAFWYFCCAQFFQRDTFDRSTLNNVFIFIYYYVKFAKFLIKIEILF